MVRALPSLQGYVGREGKLPAALTFSLAAFIKFYEGKMVDGKYIGKRANGDEHEIKDDAEVLAFFADVWATQNEKGVAEAILSNTALWNGADLTRIAGLTDAVAGYLAEMAQKPVRDVVAALV